jgi:hypothetical protein
VPTHRIPLARAATPAALALLFALLAAWSWRRWTDVHIDFGNELYTAWRLAEGEALYRDIASRNGPLSPYWNAALFRIFGVSLRTLVVANLALLALLCAGSFRLVRLCAGRLAAGACVALLLVVFGFSGYAVIGNFNYVTPYHQAQTHGLLLALGMLLAFERAAATGRARWWLAAGTALGGVFLTKAELFVPAAAVAAAACAARVAGVGWRAGRAPREAAAFAVGALLLPALFASLLFAAMPADEALRGLAGNFAHLGGGIWRDPFYRSGAGLDAPLENGLRVLAGALACAAFALLCAGADRLAAATGRPRALAIAAGLALFAALWLFPRAVDFGAIVRGLPVVAALAAVGFAARAWRRRAEPERARASLVLALWSLLALGLLGKLGLAPRISQYGFTLAMPATLLLAALAVGVLPGWLRARRGGGQVACALALAALAGFAAFHWRQADRLYARMDFPLGRGADAILAPDPRLHARSQVMADTLAWLERHTAPDSTLLVLPEGVMLNYWLRRENPIRFNLFLPTELEAFGEDRMLRELEAHPPDTIVLAHRLPEEFGVGPFGEDPRNGRALLAWVRAHYRRAAGFGPEPFGAAGFGTRILVRAAGPEPEPAPGVSRR